MKIHFVADYSNEDPRPVGFVAHYLSEGRCASGLLNIIEAMRFAHDIDFLSCSANSKFCPQQLQISRKNCWQTGRPPNILNSTTKFGYNCCQAIQKSSKIRREIFFKKLTLYHV